MIQGYTDKCLGNGKATFVWQQCEELLCTEAASTGCTSYKKHRLSKSEEKQSSSHETLMFT